MSVQVRRRREAASFLATFVGAQGELLVDTTNNRVQVHDGVTPGGWPAAKLAEVVTTTRLAVADANYTALVRDRTIAFTALTAARTVTLPAASAYPTGTQLLVVDETGACSATITITIAGAGTDTINGAVSASLSLAFGYMALESNGVGKWTQVDFGGTGIALTSQLTNRNAVINGNFAVNQRAYTSNTALAASSYAHDRWKAGSSGCTYTFSQAVPDTTATIIAGTLIQAVEAPNVYATSYYLSWMGTAQARVAEFGVGRLCGEPDSRDRTDARHNRQYRVLDGDARPRAIRGRAAERRTDAVRTPAVRARAVSVPALLSNRRGIEPSLCDSLGSEQSFGSRHKFLLSNASVPDRYHRFDDL